MKHLIFIPLTGLFLTACTPKATKSPAAKPVVDPNESLIRASKTRFPDITADKLNQGRSIYYGGACVNCHGAKNISNWDEEQWSKILDNMAKEAKLTPVEKDAVWKFIISVKLDTK
ncbi:MAG: c-type cytochrome [Bacteroidia bacterium]